VGIDVECIRPMEEMDRIAKMNFSPQEYRKFQGVSKPDRLKAFYNCWTRKEAFIKARGDGLYFPPQNFDVSFEPNLPAQFLSVDGSFEQAKKWSMHDIETREGYAAALVVEGNDYSISHKQWKYTQLNEQGIVQ
jgi:4'-phosphopantetheinyl transferase